MRTILTAATMFLAYLLFKLFPQLPKRQNLLLKSALLTLMLVGPLLLLLAQVTTTIASDEPHYSEMHVFNAPLNEIEITPDNQFLLLRVDEWWPPTHPLRVAAQDTFRRVINGQEEEIKACNGAMDDYMFFFEKDSWSNNYGKPQGDDSERIFFEPSNGLLAEDLRLAGISQIGGGYGFYKPGQYHICLNKARFEGITQHLTIEEVKNELMLVRTDALFTPRFTGITLDQAGHPLVGWEKHEFNHTAKVLIYRSYDPTPKLIENSDDNMWSDTEAPCGQLARYWIATTNGEIVRESVRGEADKLARSHWSDPISIVRPNCTPSSPGTPTPTVPPSPITCNISPTTPGVILYQDPSYGGKCIHRTSDVQDLAVYEGMDNSISSIRINGPYQVNLFEDTNYGGRREEVNHSEPNLDGRSLGEQYSSIKISQKVECEDEDASGVYLYEKPNYSGSCVHITASVKNLGQTVVGDNTVSSIRIIGEYKVELFEDKDFGGRSDEINHDESNLDTHSLGNQYSSVRIRATIHCADTSREGIYLYSEKNYTGNCAYLIFDEADLGNTPVRNDGPRSLKIVGDFYVLMYEDRDFGGRHDEFGTNQNDLTWRSLGDQYSSIKVLRSNHAPNAPSISYPTSGAILNVEQTLQVCWQNMGDPDGDALEFQVLLHRGEQAWESPWLVDTCWQLPSNELGDYLWEVRAQDSEPKVSNWSESSTFSVRQDLQVITQFSMTPTAPLAGEAVKAELSIKNTSGHTMTLKMLGVPVRGPNCTQWDCPRGMDFPWIENLTLAPDAVYHYSTQQTLIEPGNGYLVRPAYLDIEDVWHNLEPGEPQSFSIAPGLQIIEPLSLSPSSVLAGQAATAQFTIKNMGDRSIEIYGLMASGRGPDCTTWDCPRGIDFAQDPAFTLPAGQEYSYTKEQSFGIPGTGYFLEPTFQDSNRWWRGVASGNRISMTVFPVFEVIEPLTFSNTMPPVGQMTTAHFKVKNISGQTLTLWRIGVAGKGPNCTALDCSRTVDFPLEESVTIQPDAVYEYTGQRSFNAADDGYIAKILYQFTDHDWNFLGDTQPFTVTAGLQVVDQLTLSPTVPLAGDQVTAHYTIENVSNEAITLNRLGVVAKGPDCIDWMCPRNRDFPAIENVTLLPNQEFAYSGQQIFPEAGNGFFAEPAFEDANHWWYALPDMGRVNFTVSPVFETLTPLVLSTTTPAAGETVTATFALKNVSGRPLTLRRIGAAAKGPNCTNWECEQVVDFPWQENVTLFDNQVLEFSGQRAFPIAGSGYFTQIFFQFTETDWRQLGEKIDLNVFPGLQIIEPLTISPTAPAVGTLATAHYVVKNVSDRTITMPLLGVVARGPDCMQWDCQDGWADFPTVENVTLSPGAQYTYVTQRTFDEIGNNYFADAAFASPADRWYLVPGNVRVNFEVLPALPTVVHLDDYGDQRVEVAATAEVHSLRDTTVHLRIADDRARADGCTYYAPDARVQEFQDIQVQPFSTVADWSFEAMVGASANDQVLQILCEFSGSRTFRVLSNANVFLAWYHDIPLAQPVLSLPANDSTVHTSTIVFRWNAVANAVSYQLVVDDDTNFSTPEFNAIEESTAYTSTIGLSNGSYAWRIRAQGKHGSFSDWSVTWHITIDIPTIPGVPSTPVILEVQPPEGRADISGTINVFGSGFMQNSSVRLGTTALETEWRSATHLHAVIPLGISPGAYDITVINPDGGQITRQKAYTVYELNNGDLSSNAYELWTEPLAPHINDDVKIGLLVHRTGGKQTLSNVGVDFYLGEPERGGILLGSDSIVVLSPGAVESTAGIHWTATTLGQHQIFAVIDPAHAIEETVEQNNIISRTLIVLPATPDTIAPRVDTFMIDDGSADTITRSVFLLATASDPAPGTGVASLLFLEYEYRASINQWVPVRTSEWIGYPIVAAGYPWKLNPSTGVKYLQVWAADDAGNISLFPYKSRINYIAPIDEVQIGQVKFYRYYLQVGDRLKIQVEPTVGDPDLYVWAPDHDTRPPWVSNLAVGGENVDFIAPIAGVYQVEVNGYTDAAYHLVVELNPSDAVRITGESGGIDPSKSVHIQPFVPVNFDPASRFSPPMPEQKEAPRVYLPSIQD